MWAAQGLTSSLMWLPWQPVQDVLLRERPEGGLAGTGLRGQSGRPARVQVALNTGWDSVMSEMHRAAVAAPSCS